MKILAIFIILICLCATGFMFFYFDSKIKESKRTILTLNNYINKLKLSNKNQKTNNNSIIEEISIYYTNSPYQYGITLPNTKIFLAPINNSPIVNKLITPTQIKIIEQCEINKEIWYWSDLNINSTLNSKGWIKKEEISLFIDKQLNLPN